jgi:hypothetical protein
MGTVTELINGFIRTQLNVLLKKMLLSELTANANQYMYCLIIDCRINYVAPGI